MKKIIVQITLAFALLFGGTGIVNKPVDNKEVSGGGVTTYVNDPGGGGR